MTPEQFWTWKRKIGEAIGAIDDLLEAVEAHEPEKWAGQAIALAATCEEQKRQIAALCEEVQKLKRRLRARSEHRRKPIGRRRTRHRRVSEKGD